MSIQTVKNQIKTNLDALVTDNVLAGAESTDIKKNPLDQTIPAFPYAYLMPPATESQVSDNRSLERTYIFNIMVLENAENITTSYAIENLIESILNKFDNDPTLGGTAVGGVLPVSSSPEPYQHNGKDLIMVMIQIQAKTIVDLTFS